MSGSTGWSLRSQVVSDAALEVRLVPMTRPEPGPGEVVIRMEAAPINPSDIGLLLGPGDPASATTLAGGDGPRVRLTIPPAFARGARARIGLDLPVGNEGAGVVVAAGPEAEAQALVGRTVAIFGGATYATWRTARARDCLVLPPDATAAEGAACFVNPLTALGMVETLRREGHKGLAHTAAASNLGQMLNRICRDDGVPLVNIVRSPEQAERLRADGATWVVDTSAPDFMERLVEAFTAANVTLAFDAIGGGRLAGQLLTAMEAGIGARDPGAFNRYGSSVHKQVFIYGGLDIGPTEISRSFGMAWGVGGWLLTPFLERVGPEAAQRLRDRVAAELRTTFRSDYSRVISLEDVLMPDVIRAYAQRSTGEKHLINPALAGG